MGTTVAANKRFLDTSLSQSARDWDQVLDDQVELLFADELAFLRALPEWIAAARTQPPIFAPPPTWIVRDWPARSDVLRPMLFQACSSWMVTSKRRAMPESVSPRRTL